MENTINQPARFKVGQKVRVEDSNRLKHTVAKIREIKKGEEDWIYYVTYNCRDHMGRSGAVFFAEEMKEC